MRRVIEIGGQHGFSPVSDTVLNGQSWDRATATVRHCIELSLPIYAPTMPDRAEPLNKVDTLAVVLAPEVRNEVRGTRMSMKGLYSGRHDQVWMPISQSTLFLSDGHSEPIAPLEGKINGFMSLIRAAALRAASQDLKTIPGGDAAVPGTDDDAGLRPLRIFGLIRTALLQQEKTE